MNGKRIFFIELFYTSPALRVLIFVARYSR